MAFQTILLAQDENNTDQDSIGVVVVLEKEAELPLDTNINIDVHPQDSPEDRGFLILTSDKKAFLRIRGSVRLNGIYDLQGLQSTDIFDTYEIPVGDKNKFENRFLMSANQSRVGLEAQKETSLGDVFLKLETDFRNPGNAPRLRHAFGTVDQFLLGQTWSTFSDPAAIPNTVDLEGPNSAVGLRNAQIRYSGKSGPGYMGCIY